MPRPRKDRIVHTPPLFKEFKPIGVNRNKLQTINLTLDEYEAIRLADNLSLSHLEASKIMNISRSTFSRLIDDARKKMSIFLLKGMTLEIDGGNIHFDNNIIKCQDCNYIFKTSIDEDIIECPECNSKQLLNLASEYGHGRCCTENKIHRGRGFRNQKQ